MDIEKKRKTMHKVILIIVGFIVFSSGLKEYMLLEIFSFGAVQLWAIMQVGLVFLLSVALSLVSLVFKDNEITARPFIKKVFGYLALELLVVCFVLLVAACIGGLAVFITLLFPSLLSEGKVGVIVDIGYFLMVTVSAPLVIHLFVIYGYQTFNMKQTLLFVWKTFHQVYWKLFFSVAAVITLVKGISLLQNVISTAGLPWLRILITVAIWSVELLYLLFVYDSVNMTEQNV